MKRQWFLFVCLVFTYLFIYLFLFIYFYFFKNSPIHLRVTLAALVGNELPIQRGIQAMVNSPIH